MNRWTRLSIFFMLPFALCAAQTSPSAATPGAAAPAPVLAENSVPPEPLPRRAIEPSGNEDDPAYATYKDGYGLILDERWEEARKKFTELLAKFKRSDYRDDASYWSAYALKHTNSRKALKAYEDFLRSYPKSRYFDDAVADLAELEAEAPVAVRIEEPDSLSISVRIAPDPLRSFSYSIKRLGHSLRATGRALRHDLSGMKMMIVSQNPWAVLAGELSGSRLDAKTKIKVQALAALGELKEDSQSVATLREIALDRSQAKVLRNVSLYSLSRFKDADMLPVFLEVARQDTDAEMRASAVYCIANTAKDRGKTLDILTDIYRSTPGQRTDQLATILNAIAAIGTDRGVEFLAQVARTANDPELATAAIDGIGQAGDDRKKVLDILATLYTETPRSRITQRTTILYTIAEVGNDRAIDFLSNVALSDDDLDTRGNAIYLLGTIGGEKARTTLHRVLERK